LPKYERSGRRRQRSGVANPVTEVDLVEDDNLWPARAPSANTATILASMGDDASRDRQQRVACSMVGGGALHAEAFNRIRVSCFPQTRRVDKPPGAR